jgi:hypothetical protein
MDSNSTPKIDFPKVIIKIVDKIIKVIKKEIFMEDQNNAKDTN